METNQRNLEFEMALPNDCIQINVGPTNRNFLIHKSLLCATSKFFQRALKPSWADLRDSPNTLHLTEEDPEAFEIYIYWCYYHTLPARISQSTPSQENCVLLSKSYALGEILLDIPFKNVIIDAFVAAACHEPAVERRWPKAKAISILYAGTPDESAGRRLMVDFWVWVAREEWADRLEEYPREFLEDVLRCAMGGAGAGAGGVGFRGGIGGGKGKVEERPWVVNRGSYWEELREPDA
ncbi:hypothetical protein K505DRAFT_412723 [Melanomma pulvis-pyrius CBS 109.77]|uniref:BTB domain-containing protein n=1 Tax=Melanomma pulvis-pyrius CBS 109.77 TaxID=1314802 RepID=A0A6A6XW97_9PLEO|nr:hypothetical protein K505DRAFT_412723 [Melanomma pulvis-pyrius CBS 109.77]